MLSGCCGYGGAGEVQTSVPHTLLVVRLLVETEKRGCPRTETVGLLEHSQRELLQTKSTNVPHVFYDSSYLFFSPKTSIFYPRVMCQLSWAGKSASHPKSTFHFCSLSFLTFPLTEGQNAQCQSTSRDEQKLCIITHTTCAHHTGIITHNVVTTKWWAIFLPATAASSKISVQDYLLLIRGTLNLKYSAKSKELCAPTCGLLGEETALWAMASPLLEVENRLCTAEHYVQSSSGL